MAHAAMVETYLHHLLDDRFGDENDDDGRSGDGQVETGSLVGASAGGYL